MNAWEQACAKAMLGNDRDDDIVEGETVGEMDFGVFFGRDRWKL